jgi:hypothetical protein
MTRLLSVMSWLEKDASVSRHAATRESWKFAVRRLQWHSLAKGQSVVTLMVFPALDEAIALSLHEKNQSQRSNVRAEPFKPLSSSFAADITCTSCMVGRAALQLMLL